MPQLRRLRTLLGAAAALILAGPVAAPAAWAADPPNCAAFTDPVYSRVNPATTASLLTPWAGEAAKAASYGYTDDQGTLFTASIGSDGTLTPVHRLWQASTADFRYAADSDDVASALAKGYVDQGTRFSASVVAADCLSPVYSYGKAGHQRLALSSDDRSSLTAAGWTQEGVAFYARAADGAGAPPPPAAPPAGSDDDPTFSFAVMPDTQQEVLKPGDPRFLDRTQWLADHEASLDLRFATHTGDVVNWDTADHAQYKVASAAMKPLESAGIPYSLAIGNHDTQATGVGGSARDPARTYTLQRDTSTFNAYFNADRYGGDPHEFESGKVDNLYTEYEAGGVRWMVLVLELWPRASVVSWAKQQVAAHPDDNVIVVTHDYLSSGGALEQSAPYGNTTPQQLFDQLIKQYPNIKMVFSGHVGQAARRVDTGVNGNKIYSYLGAFHSDTTNPVRLVSVDTAAGTIKTWIYCPYTDETLPGDTVTETGVDFVR